jgi:hypothetical protein
LQKKPLQNDGEILLGRIEGTIMNNVDIEPTPEGIAKFLIGRTNEHWGKNKEPYLLSYVTPELQALGINYKAILGPGTTLKQFAGTLADQLKIVVHPIHKAKVGLVPATSNFVFHAEPTVGPIHAEDRPKKKPRQPSQRFIVMQFLAALSRLSEEEIKSVNIPVSILARLMEEK